MKLPTLIKKGLSRIELFSRLILRRPLHEYQLAPARAIIDSVRHGRGLEFAVMFPRQSGKNETQAQVEAFLLTCNQLRAGAEIVKAQPTFQPQALNSMRRLKDTIDRQWIGGGWRPAKGYQVHLGRACMTFFSADSSASVAGATASLLLECDEAQDVREADWDKKFLPMGASTNVTVVYWGTAWTSRTLLAKTIRHLRTLEAQDNVPRVFVVTHEQVAAVNSEYGRFVARQVAKKGRQHPLIRTQYFNEEIDGEGGMFPSSRRALMRGLHRRLEAPLPDRLYALLLDVAGEDEGAKGDRLDLAALENPKRDATALTIVEVDVSTLADALIGAPTYRVVHRRLWVGTRHTALYAELRALALHWRARYLVADNTGIGAGLVSFLSKTLPAGTVIPFEFNTRTKSDLGWDFLALCDAGRWQDYEPGAGDPAAITFWMELEFCQYEALPGPNHVLRWGVRDGTRDPDSGELIHDDTVLSAALVTALDDQPWHVPTGPTHIIRGKDPLDEMSRGY